MDFGPSMFDKFVDMTINGFVGLLDRLAKAIESVMDRIGRFFKGLSPISYDSGYGFGSGGDFGGAGGAYRWLYADPPLMASDLTHLTPAGYRRTAGALARSLGWWSRP